LLSRVLSAALLALTGAWAVQAIGSPLSPAPLNQEPQRSGQSTARILPLQGSMDVYEGGIVDKVNLPDISDTEDQKRLLLLIAQPVGAPLDRNAVRTSIQNLYATGRFSDIRVEAERNSSGDVSLSFFTAPNYFVSDLRAEGNPNRPTQGQIVNASKFQLGELFTQEKMDRAMVNINRLMQENGFYRATITHEERRDPTRQLIAIRFVVNPGPQARVGKVSVTGSPGFTETQVRDITKLHSGDLVTVQRVSSALDRLRKKYQKKNRLLAQVSLAGKSYREEANAVDYTLDIVPGPRVEVLTEGFKIRKGVLKQNVPIFEENAVDEDLLTEGRRNLRNYLQARGYFDAKVDVQKHSIPATDDLHILYVIEPGPRHKLVRVEISGNKYFRTEVLRARMKVQPSSRLFTYGRFSQGLLEGDVRDLQNLYRANGFAEVKVTGEVVDDYSGKENELALRINVDEGPQTLVGAFHLVGNKSFPEDKLRAEISTSPGEPFSEFNVAQDRDNLLNYYYNRGFPHASLEVAANPIPDQPNHMDVTFTIQEGEQFFVNKVHVSGLHYTKRYVVRREIQMKAGQPLSQVDMLDTQRRLYDLGIFNQVDTAVQNPDGSEPQKNVLIDVQEAKRWTLTYGLGLEFQTGQPSTVGTNKALGNFGIGPRGSLNISRLNFRGRDHTITFKADIGNLQQRGLVSYTAPRWFNSPDWKLTLTSFYDNTLDVTTFTSQRLEGSVQAEESISKTTTMDYRFTYRRVKATNIAISPSEIPLYSLPVRVGEPGLSFIRNARDNDLESTRGSYTTLDAAVASSYFGSQSDFSRILVQNSTYHAFGKNRPSDKKFVLARSMRVGVENAFGSTVILPPGQACPDPTQANCPGESIIPLPERFFMGGGNSHRGFGLNQAGPRDPVTGFPLGGSALFLNNLEMRFPPTPLPYFQDNISFAAFWDAGNVFTNGSEMLDNLLRWSQKDPQLCMQAATATQCDFSYISSAVGIGVRYKTPIGPVRFDFGYNLNPPAFPSCQGTPNVNGEPTSANCVTATQGSTPYFVPQHASHFNVYFSIGQSF
jgi:outer membrane protein insertion porin family